MAIYILGNHLQVQHTHAKALAEADSGYGETLILASDHRVYQRFPLLYILDGTEHELWLTREQIDNFRPMEVAKWGDPDPRCFDLANIGVSKKELRQQTVEGWITPACTTAVMQDKKGGWWLGGREGFVRPYLVKHKRKLPEVRFLFPRAQYMGDDVQNLWRTGWTNADSKERLTICAREVQKVISEAGIWGHYFPKGKAMTDVGIAAKEVEAVRAKMVDPLKRKYRDAKNDIKSAQAKIDLLTKEKVTLEKDNALLAKTVEELREHVKAAPSDALQELRRELRLSNERADKAEAALAAAREENGGWDWSRFQ